MHWSKTRHRDHEACPRRFFYAYVAAPQNPAIRKLADVSAPALIRHEAVRRSISWLLREHGTRGAGAMATAQEHARVALRRGCPSSDEAEGQITISDVCIANFAEVLLPELANGTILRVGANSPAEFLYDGLSILVQPELVVRWSDHIEIATWKTGSRDWHDSNEARLKACGLTCWARSALKVVEVPVRCSDVYLRDGVERETTELLDADLRELVRKAKEMVKACSRSAKIRDFEARPGSACKFCSFTSICPEFGAFYEGDYGIDALADVVAVFGAAETDNDPMVTDKRDFFLCHVSPDKEEVVRPLARSLEARGISYWLDEAEIMVGDSIVRAIQKGLRMARFVLCCISDAFFERGWPNKEVEAAMSMEIESGRTVVVPVLRCTIERYKNELPLMGDKRVVNWSDGLDTIIGELERLRTRG